MSDLDQTNPAISARIESIKAEIDATEDSQARAVLLYELGHAVEFELGDSIAALEHYLAAARADETLKLANLALLRLCEEERLTDRLRAQYESAVSAFDDPRDRASLYIDHAGFLVNVLGDTKKAEELLQRALEDDPDSLRATLLLEWIHRSAGNQHDADAVLQRRLTQQQSDNLKATLLCELASEARASDADRAQTLLQENLENNPYRLRILQELEWLSSELGRSDTLVVALEAQARELERLARGEGGIDVSFAAGALRDPQNRRYLLDEAACRLREVARVHVNVHQDHEAALRAYDAAIELCPTSLLLRQEHMGLAEAIGLRDASADDARFLLNQPVPNTYRAALHLRLAEQAQAREDTARARRELEAALEFDPNSTASALLEDILADEQLFEDLLARIERRATESEPRFRARYLLRAAETAAFDLRDMERARRLYNAAATLMADKTAAWRSYYAAAWLADDVDALSEATLQLAGSRIEDEERSAVLYERYRIERALGRPERTRAELVRALQSSATRDWAPYLARIYAAQNRDYDLLVSAHEAIGELADAPELAAAHFNAAARAAVRAKQRDRALTMLRMALERSNAHPYSIALLEEIARHDGNAGELVDIMRQAARGSRSGHQTELALLRAAASAEATKQPELAREICLEAAEKNSASKAPLHALRRLAERTHNDEWLFESLQRLHAHEAAAQSFGSATLELAEYYDLHRNAAPEGRKLYGLLHDRRTNLELAGALRHLLLPTRGDQRQPPLSAAHQLALNLAGRDGIAGWREYGGWALHDPTSEKAGTATEEALAHVLAADPEEPWAHYMRWRVTTTRTHAGPERGESILLLGRITEDPRAATDLLLHAVRTQIFGATARAGDADAGDEAVLLAHELLERQGNVVEAAVALEESLAGSADNDSSLEAQRLRLTFTEDERRIDVLATLAQTLCASGNFPEALGLLKDVVRARPADLASWDALREAAWVTESWNDVIAACEILAKHLSGDLRAQILEEAAAVLLDHLRSPERAERYLREVLRLKPGHSSAYERLSELLAERGDAEGLLQVITARARSINDPKELVTLLYEQARIQRSLGKRENALKALGDLLAIDPAHVGALALLAEIHTSFEAWGEAVAALRALAEADVPPDQSRIARLGAVDFLQHKLGDLRGALAELEVLERAGLADATVHRRTAEIASALRDFRRAVSALVAASMVAQPTERPTLVLQAGQILLGELRDEMGAISVYREALRRDPTNLQLGEALMTLEQDPVVRRDVALAYERDARQRLSDNVADSGALRMLLRATQWRGDRLYETAVLSVLDVLDLATEVERDELRLRHATQSPVPDVPFSEEAIQALDDGTDLKALDHALALLEESIVQLDHETPEDFGFTRRDRVAQSASHPIGNEIVGVVRAFSVPPGVLYVGGRENALLSATVADGENPIWLVGRGISAPLSRARYFRIASLAFGLHLGSTTLLRHSADETAQLIGAARKALGLPVTHASGSDQLDKQAHALGRLFSRRQRRELAQRLGALPQTQQDLIELCRIRKRGLYRAGLIVSGDLRAALRAAYGGSLTINNIQRLDEARDVVLFWLSPSTLALRRELGGSL